jgi:hypothetical protein
MIEAEIKQARKAKAEHSGEKVGAGGGLVSKTHCLLAADHLSLLDVPEAA